MLTARRPESEAEKNERLKCYFSLLTEEGKDFWVESSGLSMLPLFYRGVRVHIITEIDDPQRGQIAVFHRENKFIAHRIISINNDTGQYITKGDTLFYFDGPSSKEEFLGLVDQVERHGKIISVQSEPDLAHLSGKLGSILVTKLHWLPDWIKFLFYFAVFLPGFAAIRSKRWLALKKAWN
jgi:hypothetical protein